MIEELPNEDEVWLGLSSTNVSLEMDETIDDIPDEEPNLSNFADRAQHQQWEVLKLKRIPKKLMKRKKMKDNHRSKTMIV